MHGLSECKSDYVLCVILGMFRASISVAQNNIIKI